MQLHCGETKTQRKWFLDGTKKRDGLVDENRVNNKENKNNRTVFMLYLFAYNIKPMSKWWKMTLEFYCKIFFCKFAQIRKDNFSIPLFQMLRFSRRFWYYDTVYRRICYGFQTKTKEMDEVSFVETSSVVGETGISMNVSIGMYWHGNKTFGMYWHGNKIWSQLKI